MPREFDADARRGDSRRTLMPASPASVMIPPRMAITEAGVHHETGREHARNWALLGFIGLCVEFWIVVVAVLTAYL